MLFGARLTRRPGWGGIPFFEIVPFSGMATLPGHHVGVEDRAVAADALIPLPGHHHAAEADAHRAAHVLLHRELDRLARAHRAGNPERGRPRDPRHGLEH